MYINNISGIDNSLFKVGIYTRISVEESEKSSADSIVNQKAMLVDYSNKMGFSAVKIYEDEGKSGGNFNRPAFKQMIEDIDNGIINCIIVKDLSRFGREYIDSGYYIEKFFPEKNVRFISALEQLDSFANPERMQDIDVPITNIFNEEYLKRTSQSTKSILNVKRRDGEFVGAIVPYGYIRSDKKKNHLIIDEEVSMIVQRIFNLYSNYTSMKQIAEILNTEEIPSPFTRRKKLKGEKCTKISLWSDNVIRNILKQEIYTGDMVQGKTKSYSYKVKKRVPLPREQWTIVKDTHEAIIDKDTFEQVQEMLSLKSKPMIKKRNTKPSIINGLMYCKECGKKMQRTIIMKSGIDYYYYACSTYKKLGKDACTSHMIEESVILDTVLTTINTIVENMMDVSESMKQKNQNLVNKVIMKIETQIDKVENEHFKYSQAKSHLYADYVNGDINKDSYYSMKSDFEEKCTELKTKTNKLNDELNDYKHNNLFNNTTINTYSKHDGIKSLDRKTVVSLIKKILVDNEKSLKIIFKFQDEIEKYRFENL